MRRYGPRGWATCGNLIGLGLRPHREVVDIAQAHLTISTGVITHTMHFLDRFEIDRWLLIEAEVPKEAGGRVHGCGRVFTETCNLVATFQQDSMARIAPAALDPQRSM